MAGILLDQTSSYRINFLLERYNERLKGPTKLNLDENDQNMKKIFVSGIWNIKWN